VAPAERHQRTSVVPLTPAQRTQRAKITANTRWSREDSRPTALRAQAGLLAKFLAQVDVDSPGLPEAERQRRAVAARRAHMIKLAFQSSKARARRPAPADDSEAALT
jgi:hypothetical protein